MTNKRSSLFYGWRLIAAIYLLLLLTSHIWRAFNPDRHEPEPGQQTLTMHQVMGDSVLINTELQLAYRDVYHGTEKNPPVVLLLHGSPVGVRMLPGIINELATQHRVIAPDFPGYDASDHEIPDYSMKAYAVYMNQLLDSLNIKKAHIVGYSLGGGVAIQLAHRFPEKVESIDLLSGIGVQELELLGSHHLNHAVHGGQLFLIWMLHETVPHFGLLDDFPLNVPYARSFFDSDQRPLRDFLKEYKKPMLIQHGREDGFVPLAAAQEHNRIVPQSKLIIYDGGHGIVVSGAANIAEDITQFIQQVESGRATTYAGAGKERIREAEKPFQNIDFARVEGVTLLILMVIIALSTLFSEDLACIGAGLLAARGIMGFGAATAACFIGIFIGDVGLYLIGRWLGRPAIQQAPVRWFISESDLQRSAEWFKARGPAIIIASRFIPGSRFPTYFSAGVIGAGFWMFISYFLLAAALWTPLLVGISMLVGTELIRYFEIYSEYAVLVLIGTIFLLFLSFKFVFPLFTWHGRRLVLSRWRRLTKWEFWSPKIIYFPVVLYIGWLWLKYGKLTTFTAANPGIPGGGFIGESKSEILGPFEGTGKVASFKKIPDALNDWEKFICAGDFIKEKGLEYPIVVKPDAGQRGEGVQICRNEHQLRASVKGINYDLIIQEYIEGKEYGAFYYRYPDEERGHLFSITDKRLLTLTGDGKHTLEELILQDDHAVSKAKYHFRKHNEHLYTIPAEGETIQLVELGTHALGAVFLDGSHLITPELEQAVDELAKQFDGFYFGRFDIKAPSAYKFSKGGSLIILEVNGVTSESCIYDPSINFFEAQKTLMKQWKIAFEIGDKNRKRGYPVSSISGLIRNLINYKHK